MTPPAHLASVAGRPRVLARGAARKLGLGPDQDRHRSLEDQRALARIRASVRLPRRLPRRRQDGSVWAVTMVKNEDDIIGRVVDHLVRQGVSHLLVADNGSTDDTVATVRRHGDGLRLTLVDDPVTEYFQALKMTHLSRYAWRCGADWVVPFDADEFWFASRGRLGPVLRGVPDGVVEARIHNVFPSKEHGWVIDTAPHSHRKVCFRASSDAVLTQGNHAVHHPSGPAADTEALRILHVPWRSCEQLERKLTQGALAYVGTGSVGDLGPHWTRFRDLHTERAHRMWDSITRGEPVEGLAWNPVGALAPFDLDRALECESWTEVDEVAVG